MQEANEVHDYPCKTRFSCSRQGHLNTTLLLHSSYLLTDSTYLLAIANRDACASARVEYIGGVDEVLYFEQNASA